MDLVIISDTPPLAWPSESFCKLSSGKRLTGDLGVPQAFLGTLVKDSFGGIVQVGEHSLTPPVSRNVCCIF